MFRFRLRSETCERNWILNEKTLSLESTRGTFVSSMKNFSHSPSNCLSPL
uniref:Uncharacterized protein n=1 Tax=Arundo donax TaxID=35708 RepID=A0A0A9FN75_ARUDO